MLTTNRSTDSSRVIPWLEILGLGTVCHIKEPRLDPLEMHVQWMAWAKDRRVITWAPSTPPPNPTPDPKWRAGEYWDLGLGRDQWDDRVCRDALIVSARKG